MTGVLDKALMLAKMGRVRAFMLAERVAKPKLRGQRDVPVHIEDITPEWLASVLCADHPRAGAERLAILGGSDATTSRRAIAVTWNDAGQAAGLPDRPLAAVRRSLLLRGGVPESGRSCSVQRL